jgi:3-hydroxyacyl-[acyl-carrier-protein] dehydratase
LPRVECCFADDHPSAQGHFPGNPIIPGAVLLHEALHAIQASVRPDLLSVIKSAKFTHPARPGDRVSIEFSRSTSATIEFSCAVKDRTVLMGAVTCVPALKPP